MNTSSNTRSSAIASAIKRLQVMNKKDVLLNSLPYVSVPAEKFETLISPEVFRKTLLTLIGSAKKRIMIAALYLQDDEGGREVLSAIYEAKQQQPQLEICVFVDWHRAQRGLVGKDKSEGNVLLYRNMQETLGKGVDIYGVPVQRREFLGVMHMKGFVIDDKVLFSGASLNNVYLNMHERYRIDRYHLIQNNDLANAISSFMNEVLKKNDAVQLVNVSNIPKTTDIKREIIDFRHVLRHSRYSVNEVHEKTQVEEGHLLIAPLIGLGSRKNILNRTILRLINHAKEKIVLLTPYFNLPAPIRREIDQAIRRGCKVTIVLGDKTANDFYIPPEENFNVIGALPYLYEMNLRRFCDARQHFINSGQLNIHLWQHKNNTFHLKGLLIDEDYSLLTGHNINPRAWRLDLENGLVVYDPHHLSKEQNNTEIQSLLKHTKHLDSSAQLENVASYPPPVQKLLRRLSPVRIDRLINQVL